MASKETYVSISSLMVLIGKVLPVWTEGDQRSLPVREMFAQMDVDSLSIGTISISWSSGQSVPWAEIEWRFRAYLAEMGFNENQIEASYGEGLTAIATLPGSFTYER